MQAAPMGAHVLAEYGARDYWHTTGLFAVLIPFSQLFSDSRLLKTRGLLPEDAHPRLGESVV